MRWTLLAILLAQASCAHQPPEQASADPAAKAAASEKRAHHHWLAPMLPQDDRF